MHHDLKHSIKGSILSGIIGAIILSVILYFVDKKINWLAMVGWFVIFTVSIGFFYRYYFLHGGKVLEKEVAPSKRKAKKR